MLRVRAVILAAVLGLAPLGARGADLVVWWDEGYYAQEAEAAAEVVAAFEQTTGRQVQVVLHPQDELPDRIAAALAAGQPPDFAFGLNLPEYLAPWAFEDRLADLSDAIGPFSDLFDPDVLAQVRLLNGRIGKRALYGLPVGRTTNHLHVWTSLLEQAGLTRADLPKEWEAFWSFWCDRVQPAVRRATGRDDIYGIGLPMSVETAVDTWFQVLQFVAAYEADYVTPDGRLVIDDPEIRQKLVKAIENYTAIYRKGCTPPGSVTWNNYSNNEQFLARAVIMTPNETLSIPNELRQEQSDDYYKNVATIEWPLGPSGEGFPIAGNVIPAMVLKGGANVATAKEFVRFLVGEGWLAHYLDFSAERLLPAMPALLEQPFWLDPSDPHRMAAVMQAVSRPLLHNYAAVSGNWRHNRVWQERVWGKAVHRVAAEGISPEQAVDEAIARIKQLVSE